MPQLRDIFSVGFCSGYGDADYSYKIAEVEKLSREELNQLKLATLLVLQEMENAWQRHNIREALANSSEEYEYGPEPRDKNGIGPEKFMEALESLANKYTRGEK